MALSWVSVNANNGRIIADFPTLRADGPLKQTMMRYETQTVTLPMGDPTDPEMRDWPPKNWINATRKGAVFMVALDEPDENEYQHPLWGGLVINRKRKVGAGAVLSLITAEGYFDRVYVGDEDFTVASGTALPQNVLVKTLVEKYAKTGVKAGLPLRVEIVGGNGVTRDRTYTDAADKTLYSVLTELSGDIGGPEWTVRWEWVDGDTLGLVVSVGDRIGAPAPAGLKPGAQFDLPGSLTDAELVEGYGDREGANDVMAVSSGTGTARPQSPHQTITTDMRPRFENRFTPSTSITDVSTLIGHAQRALGVMQNGSLALALSANRQEAPRLGLVWGMGDDVGFDIEAPEFPGGLAGTARAVGWEITDTSITPLVDVSALGGID